MPTTEQIERYNKILHKRLSIYLNLEPDHIKADVIERVARECELDTEDAFSYLLASAMCFDVAGREDDRALFEAYFFDMIRELDVTDYESDPYMTELVIPSIKQGRWELTQKSYAPYEAFVYDDFKYFPDGRAIPQIGYFCREYSYPCVCYDAREWMLITPNEINTIKKPISKAHGRVLTFGLGLGYFAFMAARKDSVESVSVVEVDEDVITLFETHILPQMPCKDKIHIIHADAYTFAEREMKDGKYDVVFCDIWHDASDGVEAYKKLKSYEHLLPDAEFYYWIEDTLKYYL